MPWNGAGTFNRIYNWEQDQANGIFVRADRMDTDSDDIASGISNCIAKDGQSGPSVDISWNGFRLKSLGNGISGLDAVNWQQVFTNPVFTNPAAQADPPVSSLDQTLVTSSWVKNNFTANTIYAAVNAIYTYQNY